ncbi:hypothetical protein AJ79_04163 [Helicocarpus griseus UAMH5409]|uniref:Myb-like domain-containing protein n=1 Tax=Helicocarpus griseus UAMH5409 TaxID=1447875 RepID=A0A2B7XV65_9EURO|nr:hypothetical protein AJ79_04163 [Helicocarpus griseus UAMH5409]
MSPIDTLPTLARVRLKSACYEFPATTTTPLRRSTRKTRSHNRELGGENVPVSPTKPSVAFSKGVFDQVSEYGSHDEAASDVSTRLGRGGKADSKTGNNVYETPNADATFTTNLTRQNSRRSERSVFESPDHGNITGTTLLANDSEYESQNMDVSIMVEALPDLDRFATNALQILAPQGFSYTDLQRKLDITKFKASVKRVQESFGIQKRYYSNQHFIPVESVAKTFPSLGSTLWNPDVILQRANLAQLALDLIPYRGKNVTFMEHDFYHLDRLFPTFFLSSFPPEEGEPSQPGQSSFLFETFKLGLEIRTQVAIAELERKQESSSEYDPWMTVEEIFKIDDEVERLQGWWYIEDLDLEHGHYSEKFADEIDERRGSIVKALVPGNAGNPVDFSELESMFPWSGFITQMVKWIRMRMHEIDEDLRNQLPLDEAIELLQTELDHRSSHDQPPIQSIEESTNSVPDFDDTAVDERSEIQKSRKEKPGSTQKSTPYIGERFFESKAQSSASVTRLFELLKAGQGSSNAGPALSASNVHVDQLLGTPRKSVVPPPQDRSPQFDNEDGASPHRSERGVSHRAMPMPSALEIVKVAERQRRASSKQQRQRLKTPQAAFIDRQDGARRLSPIASSQLSSGGSRLEDRSRKRQASEVEQSDDGHVEGGDQSAEEEAFEADTRSSVNFGRNRASIAGLRGEKRRRIATGDAESVEVMATQPRTQPRSSAVSANPTQGSERRQRTGSRSLEITNVSQSQQPSRSSAVSPRVRRPGGGRIAWKPEECDQLKNLIMQHGPKWSKIKQIDDGLAEPKLQVRDQVNIKDKARQMAVDYYKYRLPLPKNFEKVPLKTDDKRKLREMGITLMEDIDRE